MRRSVDALHGSTRTRGKVRWPAGLAATGLIVGLLLAPTAPAEGASPLSPGTVFIADTEANQVLEVAPGGTPTAIGTGFSGPRGLAVDAAGDLFVADTGNNQVVEIPADGGPRTTIGTGLSYPAGVAVNATGDVYIADNDNNRVVEVPAGGGPQTTIASGTNLDPLGVAVDSTGNVFIAETGLNKVVEVPSDGGADTTIATENPISVAVDTAGDLYVAGSAPDGVVEIPAGGGPQRIVGSNQTDTATVAIDAGGDIYTDGDGKRIAEVSATGCKTTVIDSGLDLPLGVAVYAPAPTFTADTPPTSAVVGGAYAYKYKASTPAGEPAARFAVASGSLPPGLGLDPTTGLLSGTPTATGTFHFVAETINAITGTSTPQTVTVAAATVTGPDAAPIGLTGAIGSSSSPVSSRTVSSTPTPRPVITGLSPDSGPIAGGQDFTIFGNFYSGSAGKVTVSIGQGSAPAIPATRVTVGRGVIDARTGGGARPGNFFHVYVTDAGGTTAIGPKDVYAYLPPPTVTSIGPDSGPTTGCQQIEITGTGFVFPTTVEIGQGSGPGSTAIPAIDVDVLSPTEITATTGGSAEHGRWYLFILDSTGTTTQENAHNAYTYSSP